MERLEDRRVLATWSADIATDTTWTSNEVQYVTADIAVQPDVTLTIDPGTIVQFDGGHRLMVQGTLHAVGTVSEKILFTSDRDDTGFDGELGTGDDVDTENNGPTTGARGQWGNVEFAVGSTNNMLDHTEFRFGGGGGNGTVYVHAGPLRLSSSLIRDSNSAGIRIVDGDPIISNVTLRDNNGPALLANLDSSPSIEDAVLENNKRNALQLEGGPVSADRRWSNTGIVYDVSDDITVDSGATLTIDPGVHVQFDSGRAMTVLGTLNAAGTPTDKILFTSDRDDSGFDGQLGTADDVDTENNGQTSGRHGDWRNIQFAVGSTDNVLEHSEIRFGGSGADGVVFVNGAPLSLTESLILEPRSAAVRMIHSSPVLTSVTVRNSVGPAILADLASSPTIENPKFDNNKLNGMQVEAGELPDDTEWSNPQVVYEVAGDLTIPTGKTLTIGKGQIIKFDSKVFNSYDVFVNGTLLVEGTAAEPVIFTALPDDDVGGNTDNIDAKPGRGYWGAIQFSDTSTGSQLNHVDLRYGGGRAAGAVVTKGGDFTMTSSIIRESNFHGMRIEDASPSLTGNAFLSNAEAAVSMDLLATPTITGITYAGNDVNAVALDGGDLPDNTTWGNSDAVYWLAETVVVPEAFTLTVLPGKVVKGNIRVFSSVGIDVSGTLLAMGTEEAPIFFTSESDDSVGGKVRVYDSPPNQLGGWNGIEFLPGSKNSQLDRVEVRYGGRHQSGMLFVNQADLTVTNSVIHGSSNHGLRSQEATPTITHTSFTENAAAAVSMDMESNPAITDIVLANNEIDALQLDGGELPIDAIWDDPDIQYYLPTSVTIPIGRTLTVAGGQVVKSNVPLFGSVGIDVNGTLLANGTADAPVIFTNAIDHAARGPINDDNSPPNSLGGWRGFQFASTSTGNVFDHVQVRYAGRSIAAAVIIDGIDIDITNSVVHDPNGHAVLAINSATVDLVSNLLTGDSFINTRNEIAGQSGDGIKVESGSTVTAINNTIDGFQRGVSVDAGNAVLVNDLITFNTRDGVLVSGGGTADVSYADVYNPSAFGENYNGLDDPTDTNGNISRDPRYFSRDNANFQLRAGSPVIDSADGNLAPATDLAGQPRFDDPNISDTGIGSVTYTDRGAFERQEISLSDVDLQAATVSGSDTGAQDETATVHWSVTDIGAGAAMAPWYDGIYLSADQVWTPDDQLLAEVLHDTDLAPGESYTDSADVVLPGVVPGDYHFIVRADRRNDVFEALNELNNNAAATDPIAMDLPALFIGVPKDREVAARGELKYFKVAAPAGADLVIETTGPDGVALELFVSYGDVPSRQSFDARSIGPDSASQSITISSTQAGTYYVMVHAEEIISPATFTITATLPGFDISSVTPFQGSNLGKVTLTVGGSQFDAESTVRLTDSAGGTIDPLAVYLLDTGKLSATFDLTGRPVGLAGVTVVQSGGAASTLPDAFNVVTGVPGRLTTNISSPGRMRVGRTFEVLVEYANEGETDLLAPIMRIQNDGPSELRLSPGDPTGADHISLIGINPNGPAGVLPPGASGNFTLYAKATEVGTDSFEILVGDYPDVVIDWDQVGQDIRPPGLSDENWSVLIAQLATSVGDAWSDFQNAISEAAILLVPKRGMNHSLQDAFQLLIDQAFAQLNPSVAGHLITESGHPLPNVEISLYDPDTQEYFDTITLTDGSFDFPVVVPGTYEWSAGGFVLTNAKALTMDTADIDGLELRAIAGARISGNVVMDQTGMPLREVIVSATAEDGSTYLASTDNNGAYVIESMRSGPYTVETLGGAYTSGAPVELTLEDGELRPRVDFAVEVAATISGVVTGPSGPIEGAIVAAFDADNRRSSAFTTDTGAYEIDGLPGGLYTVAAAADGLVSSDQQVVLSPAGAVVGTDFNLTQSGSVSGTVTLLADGSPAAAAFLNLIDRGTGENAATTQADQLGNFAFTEVAAGDYRLGTLGINYMTTTVDVSVSPGVDTPASLTTTALGTVTGLVTNTTTSTPLMGVTVHAVRNADGEFVSSVTGVDGRYELVGMDAGTWSVMLGDLLTPGVDFGELVLDLNTAAGTVDLETAVSAVLSGNVFEPDGATPAANALVRLLRDGELILSTGIDFDGKYSFVVLAGGTYSIEVFADQWRYPSMSGLVVDGSGNQSGLDFVAANEAISGTVRDPDSGLPVAGATVRISRADNTSTFDLSSSSLTISAPDGTFLVDGLTPGTYLLTVDAAGFGRTRSEHLVTTGTVATADISLEAEHIIQGFVTDSATGAPLADAVAHLRGISVPEMDRALATTGDGEYRFSGLPAGTYSIVFSMEGRESFVVAEVDLSAPVAVQNASLTLATTRVAGVVSTADGQPLRGVFVSAIDASGVTVATTSTAADGSYSFDELPADSLTVTAAADSYLASPVLAVDLSFGGDIGDVDLTLSAAAISDPKPAAQKTASATPSWLKELLEPLDGRKPPQQGDLNKIVGNSKKCKQLKMDADKAVKNVREALNRHEALRNSPALKDLKYPFNTWRDLFFTNFADAASELPMYIVELLKKTLVRQYAETVTGRGQIIVPSLLESEDLFQEGKLDSLLREFPRFESTPADMRDTIVRTFAPYPTPLGVVAEIPPKVKSYLDDLKRIEKSIVRFRKSIMDAHELNELKKVAPKAILKAWTAVAAATAACCPAGKKSAPSVLQAGACNKPPETGTAGVPATEDGKANEKHPGAEKGGKSDTSNLAEFDPNDKIGPGGFGTEHFMQPGVLNYEIQFENDPEAGATLSAETVEITDVLDDDLDLSTLEITGFGFNNFEFDVTPGLSNYETMVDLRPEGIDLLVPVQFNLDIETRKLTADFASLDPLTGLVPDDIDAGFLPVNDKDLHNGEGFIRYRIKPLPDLPTGKEITNQASIIFGINEPILTPMTTHTIDRDGPTSAALPLDEAYGTANFMVQWEGEDGDDGSGVRSYDLYVSRDAGPFERVAGDINGTSYEFTGGVSGSTYGFATLAHDNVGHVEPMPAVADTETLVIIGAWINPQDRFDVNAKNEVTALDALLVVNELSREAVFDPETHFLAPLPPSGYAPPYFDVNMDRKITAIDALQVINELRRRFLSRESEIVPSIISSTTTPTIAQVKAIDDLGRVDEVLSLDAEGVSWLPTVDSQHKHTAGRNLKGSLAHESAGPETEPTRLETTLNLLADDLALRSALAQERMRFVSLL